MNKIIEDLNWRYACKEFDTTKKISDENLDVILEALRLTASSFGLQPWKFVLVENTEKREALVEASWKQGQVKDASHLLVLCSPRTFDEAFVDAYVNDTAKTRGQDPAELAGYKNMMMMIPKKAPEAQYNWAKNQVYIALGNLMTVCASLRIDSCPMEGFMAKKYDEILGLEELGLTSMVVCPIGYRSESDKYSSMAKIRFSQDELVVKI
jgi:nitroreductase